MRTIYYVLASRALEICPNTALAKRVREVDASDAVQTNASNGHTSLAQRW